MPDICVFYAREDKRLVSKLVELLGRKWDVWWDDKINQGYWDKCVQEILPSARSVVVVWSAISVKKDIVVDEINLAKERNIPIYPILFDDVKPPLGFGRLRSIEVFGWRGEPDHPGIAHLFVKLEEGFAKSIQEKRAMLLRIDEKEVQLPCFVFSVSSFETQLRPEAGITALQLKQTKAVLVSAYDMDCLDGRRKIYEQLREMRDRGTLVVLDSGNYEAFRMGKLKKNDPNPWTPERFARVIRRVPCDLAFCFDNLAPVKTVKGVAGDVIRRTLNLESVCGNKLVCPIIHIPVNKDNRSNVQILPDITLQVAEELRPKLIAFPERELGEGILQRAKAVASVRKALGHLSWYQPIHLLGTGNPLSIAILSAAGADLFDGLEWCRTMADGDTGLLYHYQQFDFFRDQLGRIKSPVVKAIVESPSATYAAKVAFHNLELFEVWMEDIQKHIQQKTIGKFLADYLPRGAYYDFAKEMPEFFQ